MAKLEFDSAPDKKTAPAKDSAVDMNALAKNAENGQGCAMRAQLQSIPTSEHLQIIKDLRQKEQGNQSLNIQIGQGSTPENFSFSIDKKLDPSKMPKLPEDFMIEMAKLAGKTPEALKAEMLKQAQDGKPTLLDEKINATTGSAHVHCSDEKI